MILIIDDDIAVRTSLTLLLKQEGYAVKCAANPEESRLQLRKETPELIIMDMNFSLDTSGKQGMALLTEIRTLVPAIPISLIPGWGTVDLAVRGMKAGAKDFINKPWDNAHMVKSIRTILDLSGLQGHSPDRKRLDDQYNFDHIVGEDPMLLSILDTIGRVGKTEASVLIIGESGTGKELIAEAIHQNSNRTDRPFVKVNLGGISSSLFESEMFGHKKGAFTDAHNDRKGRFEMADTGTIFLDEIGDLDKSSQVKLLRVLQDRTYEVLGSSQTRKVDTRIISATNRNLSEMVGKDQFREDLFYRINLITIQLPALRDRPGDIPLLAEFFVDNLRTIYNRPNLAIDSDVLKWLKRLPLPGNIRQLKNLVERTVLVTPKDVLKIADFEFQLQMTPAKRGGGALPDVGAMTLEEIEINMIKKALSYHNNKVTRVAKSLGLTRSALYRRLEKYEIPFNNAQE